MSAFLSPVFGAGAQLLSNAGLPLAGGKIYTYISGSVTLAATYIDSSQGIANANPIVLDSGGRPPQEIWLSAAVQYKFVVEDSVGNPVGYTYDNISGVNDADYPQSNLNEWVLGSTPIYIGPTQFSVPGNQVTTYPIGRRIKASVTAGVVYSTISAVSFGAGITTVTVISDSTSLDSGLSIVQYGLISGTPNSIPATLVTATSLQQQTNLSYTTGGGSAAFTLTTLPALVAYAEGVAFDVEFHTAAATGATINISGLGAINLVRATPAGSYTTLTVGEVPTNWRSGVVLLSPTQALVRSIAPAYTGTGNVVYSDSPALTGVPTAPTAAPGAASTQIATTEHVAANYAGLNSPAFTGTPTAPTATPGTNTTQLATTAFVIAEAFSSVLPSQPGNAGKFVTTNGTTASWGVPGLTVTPVAGTTHTAVVGTDCILNNVTACAVTAPATLVAGGRFRVCPNNGLTTNSIDVGAKTVRGPVTTATGVIPLDLGAPMELLAIDTNTWMML